MKTQDKEIKDMVRSKYNLIANQNKTQNQSSCCGSTGCCDTVDYTIFSDDYSHIEGYHEDADLGLGCGLPTEFARMKPGDTVLDLGSGAGNDCFVARSVVGDTGRVIGLDFAPAMLRKARENAKKLGYSNVEFVKGDIEEMPLDDNSIDVIVSNCVLNLVPDKEKAFRQMFRVLKPGGHFSVSDVVLRGDLPLALVKDAEMYAGCVAGAIQAERYLELIYEAGFNEPTVQKEKEINIPDEILLNYLSEHELAEYKTSQRGIYSVTVYAGKP